ncbi:MAG TPA: gliding motility-associated C-terminal domain-containing protein [Bacteroidetes bacterium]|nr:gliding motility-associated C-terminal domain-containing protein [Bacteroidota bacterium]
MKVHPLLLFLLSLLPLTTFSQQGACVKVQWSENYGGFYNESANSLLQTTDGGFLAIGYSRSDNMMLTQNNGKSDFWIVKTDSLGNLEWQVSLGGSEDDIASDAVQTPDGGYLVVGGAVSFDADVSGNHGGEDVWVVRLNASGTLQWAKTFGGSANERAEAIEPTADGNYLLVGYSQSSDGDVGSNHGDFDYWLLKISGNGTLLWEKNYGGSNSDFGFDVKQTTDGGFLLAGSTISNNGDVSDNNGFYDYWVVKTDAEGNLLWEKNYGGTLEERAYSLCTTPDGGAIIAGTSNSTDADIQGNIGSYDFWLNRIDENGNLLWSSNFGSPGEDRAFSVAPLSNGRFLVAGFTVSDGGQVSNHFGSQDAWIVQLDIDGNFIWEKNLGGTKQDRFFSIVQQSNGGYAAAGHSFSDNYDLPGNFGDRDLWIVALSTDSADIDLGPDTTLCANDALVLQTGIDSASFLWSDGSTLPFLLVSTNGSYWVEINQEGCLIRDTIKVEYLFETPVGLGTDTTLCQGDSLLLAPDIAGADYQWQDGSSDSIFWVKIPGRYWVRVVKDGCEQRDSIEVDFVSIPPPFPPAAFLCQGEQLLLDASQPQASYLWHDGSVAPQYTINGPGLYWVRTTIGGCRSTDTVMVDFQPGPDSIFTSDYICEGQGIWFDASFPGASYLWNNGSTLPRLKAVTPGPYSVEVTVNGCLFKEATLLRACEECLYIPNIFSPNGDGINDVFRTFPACDLTDYHQRIFDRWGNIVFESFSPNQHWDGNFNGQKANPGTYIYFIEYLLHNNQQPLPQMQTGTVTIIW